MWYLVRNKKMASLARQLSMCDVWMCYESFFSGIEVGFFILTCAADREC